MSRNLVVGVAMFALIAHGVSATPVVDGVANVGEYPLVINDTPNEVAMDFFNTGLDIDTVQFDVDNDWYYLCVTVVNEPIDTDGDPSSLMLETEFGALFLDGVGGTSSYYVEILTDGTDMEVWLEEFVGGAWQDVALGPGDYDVAIGDALELRLSMSLLANLAPQPTFLGQLDGTGQWNDDQIGGLALPEPAALGLMGLGGLAVLIRRRRAA